MTTTTSKRRTAAAKTGPPDLRVAIYTRKSVDKPGGSEFGSIDAQRAAVEAYGQSQSVNGWQALPTRYDDLGISGATTDRPALQRLLADIDGGQVDVVAVYRLDRISRSQRDFVGLLERFEAAGITFVSITEHFDTTTPHGRFTLGILIQVAQLEREVTAERIRDKVRESRRQGYWHGGFIPLGYERKDKALVVHKAEAKRVRGIFETYVESGGSIMATLDALAQRGWRHKTWRTKAGKTLGGGPFTKATLRKLLGSVLYRGQLDVDGEVCEGKHDAIIDEPLWDEVQALLASAKPEKASRPRNKGGALLAGLVRCGVCGATMGHHFTGKKDRRYHSYVCATIQKRGAKACPGSRVPMGELDAFVVDKIQAIGSDPELVAETVAAAHAALKDRGPAIRAELKALRDQRAKLEDEQQRLVDAIAAGTNGSAPVQGRLDATETALAELDAQAVDLRAQLAALKSATIDEADLRAALEGFTPVWDELFPAERARIAQLLIQEVTVAARTGDISLTFRPAGIRSLAQEHTGEPS